MVSVFVARPAKFDRQNFRQVGGVSQSGLQAIAYGHGLNCLAEQFPFERVLAKRLRMSHDLWQCESALPFKVV